MQPRQLDEESDVAAWLRQPNEGLNEGLVRTGPLGEGSDVAAAWLTELDCDLDAAAVCEARILKVLRLSSEVQLGYLVSRSKNTTQL